MLGRREARWALWGTVRNCKGGTSRKPAIPQHDVTERSQTNGTGVKSDEGLRFSHAVA